MAIRVLGPGDEEALEAFLRAHAESSMFLRSNLRAGGLVDRGEPYQATYAAALDGGRVVAVAAHCWNDTLLPQAPLELPEVVRAAVRASARPVARIVGPWGQVVAAREALGLLDAPASLESRQILFALRLRDLVVPALLASGGVRCRHPRADELPGLVAWRVAYEVESLGATDGDELHQDCAESVERLHRDRVDWLLVDAEQPLAYCTFNARLPDTVQIGGVFTPPALRSRGYSRCVVAGALLAALAEGVERAVLFTDEDNVPAQRSYVALGFREIGDYGILLLADRGPPS